MNREKIGVTIQFAKNKLPRKEFPAITMLILIILAIAVTFTAIFGYLQVTEVHILSILVSLPLEFIIVAPN